MTRRRLGTPGFIPATRGRSVMRHWSYGGRASSPVDDLYFTDLYRPRHHFYDTTGEENDIRKSVNRELLFSRHAVEDGFDTALKSKSRDQHLLREASQALVDTEIHASPKVAVLNARRARSVSVAPTTSYTHTKIPYHPPYRRYWNEVDLLYRPRPASVWTYADYKAAMADWVPPRRSPVYPLDYYSDKSVYRRYPITRRIIQTAGGSKVLYSRPFSKKYFYEYYATPAPKRAVRVLAQPLHHKYYYWPWPKAAIVGRKVDVVTPKRSKPKSEYAATAIRRIMREKREQTSPPEDTTGTTSTTVTQRRRHVVVI